MLGMCLLLGMRGIVLRKVLFLLLISMLAVLLLSNGVHASGEGSARIGVRLLGGRRVVRTRPGVADLVEVQGRVFIAPLAAL